MEFFEDWFSYEMEPGLWISIKPDLNILSSTRYFKYGIGKTKEESQYVKAQSSCLGDETRVVCFAIEKVCFMEGLECPFEIEGRPGVGYRSKVA